MVDALPEKFVNIASTLLLVIGVFAAAPATSLLIQALYFLIAFCYLVDNEYSYCSQGNLNTKTVHQC